MQRLGSTRVTYILIRNDMYILKFTHVFTITCVFTHMYTHKYTYILSTQDAAPREHAHHIYTHTNWYV